MSLVTSGEFDDCRRWIKKKRNKGNTWDSLLFAGKATEQALENFLNNKKDEDDWPPTMSVELWKKDAAGAKCSWQRKISCVQSA